MKRRFSPTTRALWGIPIGLKLWAEGRGRYRSLHRLHFHISEAIAKTNDMRRKK